MNRLFNESINNFIVSDNNRLFGCNFDETRYFNWFLDYFLSLINLWNLMNNLHDLVIVGCYLFDFLFAMSYCDGLFLDYLNLFHLFCDIWDNLFDFSVFLLNNDLLLDLRYLLYNSDFLNHLHESFDIMRNLFDLLNLFFNQDQLLDNFVTRYWELEWYDNCFLYFDYFLNFNSLSNNFFLYDFLRNLHSCFDYFFMIDIYWLENFFILNGRDNFLSNHLHLFVDRYLYVLDDLNFNDSLLNNRDVHLLDDFFNLLDLDNPIDNFFYNLWNLDYFLDNPRHYHYFFNYLFNLDHFRHFYQFFDNLINGDPHFLYFLYDLWYFYNGLYNDFYRLFNSNIFYNWLLNFQNLNNFHHFLHYLFNLDNLNSLVFLSNNFFTNLFNCHYFLLDHWNFNSVLNNLDYLLDQGDHFLNYTLHFFYSILIYNFLFNYFNFLDSGTLNSNFNNFLYNFNYLFDLLDCLDDWDNFLDNSFDNLRHVLNIINHFSGWLV